MNEEDLIHAVDERRCLEFLSYMVQQKSYPATDGERRLAGFMVDQMCKLGFQAELQPVGSDRFNAIGRLPGTGGGKSLLFNGHLDTNPVGEGWTVDPWGGLVDEKFIYGIGVSNMKAGDAAYFCAVKTLLDHGIRLKGDVVLTFVVGELQGGIGTLEAIRQGTTADYFINSEPTDLRAMTMHAGTFTFLIKLFGQSRHLSKREEAVDAIAAACELIPSINALSFKHAKSLAHHSINRCHVGVMHSALGKDLYEWRPQQVADYAKIEGSGRFAPGQTADGAIEDIRAVLREIENRFPGLKSEILSGYDAYERPIMPPFEVSEKSPIVRSLNAAYRLVRGEEQPTGVIVPASFYGTDAGHFYQELGMEGVVCGPGGRYNTMPDERVDICDFLDMIRIYMQVILDVCTVAERASDSGPS